MRQMDYGYNQPLGLPGGIYDLSDKTIVTRVTDPGVEAKTGMGFVQGAKAGKTVALPSETSTAAAFEGIFVHGSKNMEHDLDGVVATAGGDAVGVMQKGRIWGLVASTATTTYGVAVALITGGANAGKFTDSADAAETKKVALGAKFTGVADAVNGIAVIELR